MAIYRSESGSKIPTDLQFHSNEKNGGMLYD